MNKKSIYIISILIVLLSGLLYFATRMYTSSIMAQNGYFISKNKVEKELLSTKNKIKTRNINLEKISKEDTVFYSLGKNYVANNNKKKEINTKYPIYSNDGLELININSNNKLINVNFKEFDTYENCIIVDNKLYNYFDREEADFEKYIFLKTEDGLYINLSKIEVSNNKNIEIPINSIINFTEEYIKYFYYDNSKKLYLNVIPGISYYTDIKIGDKEYKYGDFLNLLNNITIDDEEENNETDEIEEEYIINDEGGYIGKDSENNELKYVKPTVRAKEFVPNIYTATSTLYITDPARVITGGINFQLFIDNKLYARKAFTSSGQVQIKGLKPNTEYHIVGNYKYYNEEKKKIEVEFFTQDFKTGDFNDLDTLDLSFENGDIYSNKIEIKNIEIKSGLDSEMKAGLSKGYIVINDNQYSISFDLISRLIKGEKVDYTSPEGLVSNKKQDYEIVLTDSFGNKLKISNNKGSSRTSKEKPSVNITLEKSEINKITLKATLKNKDDVNINNYRAVIYNKEGSIISESNLDPSKADNIIEQKNLSANETYKLVIYGNYDTLDGNGTRENEVLGETNFTTLSLSSLGYIRMLTNFDNVTHNSARVNMKIDRENVSEILLELLSRIKVEVKDPHGIIVFKKEYTNENLIKLINGETISEYIRGLDSKTKYTINYESTVSLGTKEESIKTTSGINDFTTYKQEAYVSITNQFVNNNMIDYDVRVVDDDGAISSKRVILEVRDPKDELVEIKELDINGTPVQVKYNHLTENSKYSFKYYVEGYNIGYTNSTYKSDYSLKEEELITEASVVGNLELLDITTQIESNNLFNINDHDRIRKAGNTGYKEYDIENNAIMFGSKNGYSTFAYYIPEAYGKRVRINFLAKYDPNSKYQCDVYINDTYGDKRNNNWKLNNLTTEYKEYTFEFNLTSTYIGFEVYAPASVNQRTNVWIKDLKIIQVSENSNIKLDYSKYVTESNKQIIFTKTVMKAGNEFFKSYEDESAFMRGNPNDGYAIITGVNTRNTVKRTYSVTKSQQEFVVPETGKYRIELWGAGGGKHVGNNDPVNDILGGKGAYTSGEIELDKDDILYVYVGSRGEDGRPMQNVAGGYNGGGIGARDGTGEGINGETDGGGGGATDVRLVPGAWDNEASLKSRIMVAAGGGGGSDHSKGGDAGALSSFAVQSSNPATQFSGYALGKGEPGRLAKSNNPTAGGGGGYYGGYSTYGGNYYNPGSGGSSYISGHKGCISITSKSIAEATRKITDESHERYDKFKEDDEYQANLKVSLHDYKNAISDSDYYIKVYKDGKLIQTERYDLINSKVIDNIKDFYLAKNKKYTMVLSVKIRDRFYDLDELDVKTNTEVRQIKTAEELFNINPNGKYVVVDDIDISNINQYILDLYGEIDFQGHKLYLNWNNRSYFVQNLRAGATIKNVIINFDGNTTGAKSWNGPFIYRNYGTLDNVIFNVVEGGEKIHVAIGLMTYVNYGRVTNFIVNSMDPIHIQNRFGFISYQNEGTIENGYIYGENICGYHETYNTAKDIGSITGRTENNSVTRNVYILTSVDKNPTVANESYTGNAIGITNNGRIQNIISVETKETTNNLSIDPNIGRKANSPKISNIYYASPRTYTKSGMDSSKVSYKALYDVNFIDKLLNSSGQNSFEIEKYVQSGYYPQLKLNNCMPQQQWIKLPALTDADVVEVTSVEEESVESSTAIVKVHLNNPSEETVKKIEIQSINGVEILSQENKNGKSVVRIRLSNPVEYKTKYSLTRLRMAGKMNYEYDKTYSVGAVLINISMYYPISTLTDWKMMQSKPTYNYILMNDMDFNNISDSQFKITANFSGILNGNNKTIRNIKIENASGVFNKLTGNGTIKNLFIENFVKTNKTSQSAFVALTEGTAEINNVHIKNATLTGSGQMGALVGNTNGLVIKDSSATNVTIKTDSDAIDIRIGGLVGYSTTNCYISNCYVNNVDIEVLNSTTTYGVGGLIGQLNTGVISNAYATGKIKTNSLYTGGIAGVANGMINNCWSDVDISSRLDFVGGIVGKRENEVLSSTLVFGDVYSSINTEFTGRTTGNSMLFSRKNYYWDRQDINGIINYNSKAEKPLTSELINKKDTYYDILDFGDNFDYTSIENGILPKLKSTKGELLPNQVDYQYESEFLKIKNIEVLQDVTKGNIQVTINNPMKYEITGLTFDYLKYENSKITINTNIFNEDETIITINDMLPERYYDSYKITEISYISPATHNVVKVSKNTKVDMHFMKSLSSPDDWNRIEDTEENYRLTSDIDFAGITNIKKNISIGRLEGQNHTIKNITIENVTAQTALIKKLTIALNDITFDNIRITKKSGANISENINLIKYNIGNIENLTLKDITLDAAGTSYVTPIGRNRAQSIRNVKVIGGTFRGLNYVSGFIGYSQANDAYNVSADGVTVDATGDCVGGLVGNRDYDGQNKWFSFEGKNLNVTGRQNTGGLFGYGAADNTKISDSTVKSISSGTRLGGIAGYNRDRYAHNYEVDNVTVIAASTQRVGIAFGEAQDTSYVRVTNSSVTTNGTGALYTGAICGYKGGYSNHYNYVEDSTVTSSASGGTGGIFGYFGGGGGSSYNAVVNTTVNGVDNVGGAVGYGNLSRLYYTTVNATVKASGINAGGVYGKIGSVDQSLSNYSDVVHEIILENTKVTGNDYVSLFTGFAPQDLAPSFFYNIYLIGDVYCKGIHYGVEIPRDSTNTEVFPIQLTRTYVYKYNRYIREGATTNQITDLPFLRNYINNSVVTLINSTNLATQSYYTGHGITTSYFSFASGSYSNLPASGYYPITKNVSNQRLIQFPADNGNSTNGTTSSFMNIQNSTKSNEIPKLDVYSSGIDTINLEFEDYNDQVNMEIYKDDKLVIESQIIKRTFTYKYDYLSNLKIILDNGINKKEYTYKPEDIGHKATTFKDKYAYIYEDKLKGNIKINEKKYIHLYKEYALTKDLEIYDITTGKKIGKVEKELTEESEIKPLFEFEIKDKKVKTFYNYSIINNKNGDMLYDNQLFYSNGELEIVDSNTDNIKTTAIIENSSSKNYVTVLGKDGIIYNLKDEIVLPSKFNNSNIKWMTSNVNNDSKYIIVVYESGRVVIFDYHNGKEVVEEKATENISLFDYLKTQTTKKIASVPDMKENRYARSLELKELLEEKPLEEINKTESKINNNKKTSKYITYYNAVKNDYDIIDTTEILNISNDDKIVTENDKIYSSSNYVNFYMKDSIATKSTDRINIVILISIIIAGIIITLGLAFINNKDFKSKEIKS